MSGTMEGGDCIMLVRGEKSITSLAISVNFFLGTKYVLIPYKCMFVESTGARLTKLNLMNCSKSSSKYLLSWGESWYIRLWRGKFSPGINLKVVYPKVFDTSPLSKLWRAITCGYFSKNIFLMYGRISASKSCRFIASSGVLWIIVGTSSPPSIIWGPISAVPV